MSLRNLVAFEVEKPAVADMEKNKPYYVLQADGVYRYTKKESMLVKELFSALDKNVPLLAEGEEGFEYLLPKMPMKVYLTILNFYKAVYAKSKTEASCHVFYLEEGQEFVVPAEFDRYKVGILQIGQWLLYCPQQTNSGTLTSFREDQFYPYLRKNYTIMMETHSHHTMGAFWSGTDNANQKDPILYGVFGQINTNDDFLVKFVWNGININIEPELVVDYPRLMASAQGEMESFVPTQDLGVYKGKFNYTEDFPKKWLYECHKTEAPSKFGSYGAQTGRMPFTPEKTVQTTVKSAVANAAEGTRGTEQQIPPRNGYDKPLNAYSEENDGNEGKKSEEKNARGGSVIVNEKTKEENKEEKQLPPPRHNFYN